MLTNPTTSSTSVTSSSLVEVTSLTSPSSSASSAAPLPATSQETTVVPIQIDLNPEQTPAKRRKKSAKANSGIVPSDPLAAEVNVVGATLSVAPAPPPPPPGNRDDKNSGKRSRKQKIDTLRDVFELTPFAESQSVSEKQGKRRKGAAPKGSDNVSELLSESGNKKGKNVKKNNVNKSRVSPGLLRKTLKKDTSATTSTTPATDANSVVSYDPQQKIVLKKDEFIDPNLSFTIFPDLSRGLGAIGPSQVIIAVELTREPGTTEELISDRSLSKSKSSKKPIEFKCQQLSLFLSVPHFLPLNSVYSSGEPFARILRFSALEQYTQGVLGRNQVSSFRFFGPRYENQVPAISAFQEKDPRIVQLRKRIPNPSAYSKSILIIKHPILGFYSRKLVNLKFIILKKIDLENTVVGHLKAKVVQLRRSADLKNIEIYVDESRVPEEVSDVNAMNQQNIQPVIHTPSGLVPVITRTAYQAHQLQNEYQIEQQPHQPTETQEFQYVQYHYQTASELVQEISANSTSNFILNLDNAGEYFGSAPTFRDESGAQVLILSPGDLQSSSSFISHQQPQQQLIHQQQQESASFYTNQEQPVVIQQHQYSAPTQQLQQQQQQQTYAIQPQEQIIQIQPSEPTKEVRRQILYLSGSQIPIEIQFPEPQVVEPTRVYPQQPEQLQVQVQRPQQEQFRSGQQIVVQQQPSNQYQIQPQQAQVSQVVIRQQPQQHQFTQQSSNTTSSTAPTYQYGNSTQQQQQIIVQQPSQQSHLHQQPQQQLLSSCIQQAHQHQAQLQGVQQTSHIRFQPVQQQQQQAQPSHLSQVQPRPQLIQQAVPALQSSQNTVPVAGSPLYQQRPPFPQQVQTSQQQQQFVPARAPLSPSVPQALPPPPKQKGKAKQSKKNSKAALSNQVTTNTTLLTPQQLEQLRQRESGYHPSSEQQPQAPPQTHSTSPIRPGVTSPYAPSLPQVSSSLRPVSPQQHQQVLRFTPQSPVRNPIPGSVQPIPRTRPPAPPPPIISNTTSLARFPSVSPGTTPTAHVVAPKSQVPSASSAATLSSLAVPPTTASSASSPGKKPPKTLLVVSSSTQQLLNSTTPAPPAIPPVAQKQEFKTKPGHLAVCPHCGVGNKNILRCNRCKHELPTDVKFIKDEWEVNKGGAAVAIPAPKTNSQTTSTPTTTTTTASGDTNSNSKATTAKGKAAGARKILVVNKPQAPVPTVQGTSVLVNKTVVAPGTVHVQIQPDGGSAVTINSGGVSVVQTKAAAVVTKPKRRAPARKRQAHECITLSSDEEEPEPPTNKSAKLEEKSADSTESVVETSTKTSTANSIPAVSSAVVTSTANTSTTPANATGDCAVTSTQVQEGEANQTTGENKAAEPATTGPEKDNMNKKIQINFTDEPPGPSKKEADIPNDPTAVFGKIEEEMGKVAGRFQYATFTCRSLRVGSYKVTSSDTGFSFPVLLTELGIKFSLPYANYKRRMVKICIPMESILSMKVHFHKRLQVMFITTGPKYAAWIRQALGLDGSPKNESSNYYCPLEGNPSQKTITFLGESFEEADIGTCKKLYSNVMKELEYHKANDFLMQITPQSFRSSIGINSDSPDTSPGPKIVSATSLANSSVPSPSGSTISTASTVIIAKKENSTQAVAIGGSAAVDKDPEGVILFYEGRNNIKVPICPNDIKCLTYAQFLNDQIIDFWLAVIQTEILSEEDKSRTFVFDSFFYSKLTEKMKKKNEEDGNLTPGERRHMRVKKRTKNVDIFSKDFLIVPINENYHWFIAIICFPGIEGYHDYNTMEPLPNYKRPRTTTSKSTGSATTTNNNKKPIVYNQPKNETTASYSNRDEAPEDPEEMDQDQISSPDTPGTDGSAESKSQGGKTEAKEPGTEEKAPPKKSAKRKSEFGQAVKHPCILIFDSLAGDTRGRIYPTLREYLKIEYKTKKKAERVFDKNTMPGAMPKVPQQPNFSDCGLFMLQYVESFFSNPIPTYETKDINLKQWFEPSTGENKRREIYDFIKKRVSEKCPQNVERIPDVRFEPDENDLLNAEEEEYHRLHRFDDLDDDDDEDYDDEYDYSDEDEESFRQAVTARRNVNSREQSSSKKASSDSDDHNYATTPPKTSATAALAASLPTVVLAITPLPPTSDTTKKSNT